MVRGHINLFFKHVIYNCSSTFMTPSASSYGNETSAAYYSVTSSSVTLNINSFVFSYEEFC